LRQLRDVAVEHVRERPPLRLVFDHRDRLQLLKRRRRNAERELRVIDDTISIGSGRRTAAASAFCVCHVFTLSCTQPAEVRREYTPRLDSHDARCYDSSLPGDHMADTRSTQLADVIRSDEAAILA